MAPVRWEDGWPLVNPGRGVIEFTLPAPALPEQPFPPVDMDDWHAPCWNYLGTPDNGPVRIDGKDLYIRCVAAPLIPAEGEAAEYAKHALGFYGRRQQDPSFTASCRVTVPDERGVSCGMVVLQNDYASLRLELRHEGGAVLCRAVKARKLLPERRHYAPDVPVTQEVLGETLLEGRTAELTVSARGSLYTLWVNGRPLIEADGGFLGSETCHGFVGAYIGLFASGNGSERACEALFRDFTYRAQD